MTDPLTELEAADRARTPGDSPLRRLRGALDKWEELRDD